MKEVKFRAWSAGQKQMCGPFSLEMALYGHSTIYKTDDIVFMQFTGLRDKNDREIYEGDIVTDITTEKGVVEYGRFVCDEEGRGNAYGFYLRATTALSWGCVLRRQITTPVRSSATYSRTRNP
jgi:hypothetical protein